MLNGFHIHTGMYTQTFMCTNAKHTKHTLFSKGFHMTTKYSKKSTKKRTMHAHCICLICKYIYIYTYIHTYILYKAQSLHTTPGFHTVSMKLLSNRRFTKLLS